MSNLTYLQVKTKPYLLEALQSGKSKPWEIYRYISENMAATPSFSTMEKLIKKMLDGGELSREWVNREWVYKLKVEVKVESA